MGVGSSDPAPAGGTGGRGRSLASVFIHPFSAATLRAWLYGLERYGGPDPSCWPVAAVVTALNLAYLPLRLLESAVWTRRIGRTAIVHPPIFILGHWRTGTTYLHYLFARDPALAYLNNLQALIPCGAMGGSRLLPLLTRLIKPQKRVTDDVVAGLEDPQEEEFAVAGLSPYALYSNMAFIRSYERIFREMVLFDPAFGNRKAPWKKVYLRVLRAATLAGGGRRLVLKNPCNTARIPALLELFPDAKFVHIIRDPLETYLSSLRLFGHSAKEFALQSWDDELLEELALHFYREISMAYGRDRALIPEGNLAEVRFEDLVRNPVGEMARMYSELGLPGFEAARPAMEALAGAQSRFRRHSYRLQEEQLSRLIPRLRFAYDELGYDLPGGGDVEGRDGRSRA